MTSTKLSRLKGTRRRAAFSLVLSLAVMAMLLLLCVGAAALLTIQLRVAQASVSAARARLNALAGARIALGTLQGQVGPDTRITAPATILDTNPSTADRSEGVALPRLTGVWRGRSVNSDYTGTHDKAFIGWLVSGAPVVKPGDKTALNYPKVTTLDESNAARLLLAPSAKPASDLGMGDDDAVDVFAAREGIPRANGGSEGTFAWWVSDENQKANLTLRLPADTTVAGALHATQNSPRFGLKLASDGEFAGFPETVPFNPAIVSRNSLVFDRVSAGAGKAWLSEPKNYFHHITPYSETLLTDTVNGGLKYDLSLLLAMDKLPEGYFGNTAYVGLESGSENPRLAAKGRWLSATGPTKDIMTNFGAANKVEWTCWGDVWNYARLYKRLDPSTGEMTMNSAADAYSYANHTNPLDPAMNVTDHQNLSAWREPVVTQFQVALGLYAKPVLPAATPAKYKLAVVTRPSLQLWNPYNVPLKFTGSTLNSLFIRYIYLPACVDVKYMEGGVKKKLKLDTSPVGTLRNFFLDDGNSTFVAFIDHATQTTLAPGEVRVFSPPASLPSRPGIVDLLPGLRPAGGYEYTHSFTFDGNVEVTLMEPELMPEDLWGNFLYLDWGRRTKSGSARPFSSPGRGWRVNRYGANVSAGPAAKNSIMPVDNTPIVSTIEQLTIGDPRFFALFTMRLRSETTINVAGTTFPYLMYGDAIRSVFQPNASVPYKQNQSLMMSPYELIHKRISGYSSDFMQVNGNQGYAFTGYDAETGVNRMVLSHIPLVPLAGMGDLRDARLGGGVAYSRPQLNPVVTPGTQEDQFIRMSTGASVVQNAFGNSFAHPIIKAGELTGSYTTNIPDAYYQEKLFDTSWIMNSALWDSYCITGITAQDSPFTALGQTKTLDAVTDNFFAGKGLPNSRLIFRDYGAGTAAMKAELISGDKPTPEGYVKSAAMMSVNGGFNINSTSVRAWRAILSGLNEGKVVGIPDSALNTPTTEEVKNGNPVLRNSIQNFDSTLNGMLADINSGAYDQIFNKHRTLAGRKLSDTQLTQLAQKIVEQVKLRGPFLSMGEFMNRRLEEGPLGKSGALQSAIDATDINKFTTDAKVQQVKNTAPLALPNDSAVAGTSQARGMPGVISQADLVGPVASQITPRSDTFTIRASGSSDDGATAYVELVVRRTAAFIDATDKPFATPDNMSTTFKTANKAFGRRFEVVASRWINSEDL